MSYLIRVSRNIFQKFQVNRSSALIQTQLKYSQKSDEIKVSRKKTYVYTAFIGVAAAVFAYYVQKEKQYALIRERQKLLKKSGIGGKWELIDVNGNIRTTDDFKGKWCMIYFGFTHCPDVCPDEMEKMTNVTNGLDKENIDLQPVFITIDPDRDTKEVIGKYLKEFSNKIVGLTGSMDEIKKVCHAFNVYFKAGPKDQSNDYIVDHTIILYLVDPNGQFIDYYGRSNTTDEIIASVKVNMDKWRKLQEGTNLLSRLIN